MSAKAVSPCGCPRCQQGDDHPERAFHRQINLLLSRLDEAQRRWYVAVESNRIGHGGDRLLAQITGLDEQTIRRGRAELATSLADCPAGRVRRPGGGRHALEKKSCAGDRAAGGGGTRDGGRPDARAQVGAPQPALGERPPGGARSGGPPADGAPPVGRPGLRAARERQTAGGARSTRSETASAPPSPRSGRRSRPSAGRSSAWTPSSRNCSATSRTPGGPGGRRPRR